MAQYSQEQADALLAKGAISPETHQLMVGSGATAPPSMVSSAAPIAPIDNTWLGGAPSSLPSPVPQSFDGSKAHTTPKDVANPLATSPVPAAPAATESPAMIGPPGPVPPAPMGPSKMVGLSSPAAPKAAEPSRDAVANGEGIPKAPAAPEGPSRDPRVNKRIAQYEKQYAPVRDAQDREVEAAGEVVRREGERDDKLAQNSNEFVMRSSIMQAEGARDEQNYQAESAAQRERIKLASDDAAKSKVNANAFWDNKSTAEKIAGVLAIGLGAVGASLARTDNFALSMINAAISRDIAAQEKNLDGKWKKVDSERGVLSDLRSVYGDKRIARSDAYAAAYKQTIAQGDAIAANAKSDVAKANWEQLRAGLEVKVKQHDFEVLQGMEAQQKQADAAAGAAARAQAAELRKTFMERYGKTLDAAQLEILDASKSTELNPNGRPAAPWAVQAMQTAASLGMPTPGTDTGATAGGANNTNNPVAHIPGKLQPEAIKELSVQEKKQGTLKMLDTLEQDAKDRSRVNPMNLVPGTSAGDRNKRIDVLNSQIVSLIRGQGDSDAKSEERLKQLQIDYTDNDATITFKVDQLRNKVTSNNPTPILDKYPPKGGATGAASQGPKGPASGLK